MLLAARNYQEAEFKKAKKSAKAKGAAVIPPEQKPLLAQLDPTAFYMTLAKTKKDNPNIPGEQRVPLPARDMAEDFWGWPDNYTRKVSPRFKDKAKEERIYWNWSPKWKIWSADDPAATTTKEIRMYYYENSSDFRVHPGALNQLGAVAGDIIQLTKVDREDATYDCALAKQGTPQHAEWTTYLVNKVKSGNSERAFGFI
jgi:hypothetical protein